MLTKAARIKKCIWNIIVCVLSVSLPVCPLFSHHLMWSKAIGICAQFLTKLQYSSHAA